MKEACRRQCASFRYVSFTYSIIYVQDKCFVVQSSLPRPSVVYLLGDLYLSQLSCIVVSGM